MSMVGKTFKQKMAAFLAVCMVASAVPTGPVFAAEEPKEESSAASLVEFDVEKLKEAVEKAVKKDDMVAPPVVVASSSVANFDTSSYELSGATNLLKDGTEMPDDTDLRIFLVPDDLGYDADNTYTVTGNESLIFMLENTGKEEQGYQLVFGNKITDVIEVKSKAQLLHEYEMGEEESEAETSKATPSNAESIQEGQIAPENDTQAQTPAEDTSGQDVQNSGQEAASQESTSADSIQEGQVAPENETTAAETEAAAEESQAAKEKTEAQTSQETKAAEEETAAEEEAAEPETEAEAVQEDETEAEVEEKEPIVISNPEEEDEEEAASQVTIGKIFDVLTGSIVAYGAEPETTATPSDASEEDKPAADVPETSEPVKETPETTAPAESVTEETTEAETETAAETTAAPEETTSAPAEEATVPAQATEEASPSNATEAEETVDRTFESAAGGYVKLNAEISASTLIMRKDSFEKEEVTGILKPMARMVSLFAGDDAEDDTKVTASSTRAVAFVTAAYGDVMALAETSGADIKVNLYDYSGTDSNNGTINQYLSNQGLGAFKFKYSGTDEPMNSYEYVNNGKRYPRNIYQGILTEESEFGENGETLLNTLFPDEKVSGDAITSYLDVNTESFFNVEGTRYTYNSNEESAKYDIGTNTLSAEDGSGFWPMPYYTTGWWGQEQTNYYTQERDEDGEGNYFFGMKMETTFYRPVDGKFGGEDLVFNFSGDDDVWVFIENENGEKGLVLDIGGIHGRMDGSINFATGEVTYSRKSNNFGNEQYENAVFNPAEYDLTASETETTPLGNKVKTYKGNISEICPGLINLNQAGTYKLTFYYLERGGVASNCSIDFNLLTVPKEGITIAKSLSGKIDDEHRNADYNFRLVYSDNFAELDRVRMGELSLDEATDVGYEILSLKGAERKPIQDIIEEGMYFYVEEDNPSGTSEATWEVTTSEGTVSSANNTTAGTRNGDNAWYSAIYHLTDSNSNTGFLFMCTNHVSELTPTVAKTANETAANSGIYDITLSVTGDEGSIETGTGGGSAVDMVVVLDKSKSMADATYDDDVRTAVLDLAQSLSEKSNGQSRMRIVTFGGNRGTGTIDDDASYYGESGDANYYNILTEWQTLNEETVAEYGTLFWTLRGIKFNENTHSAGGFLGAEAAFAGAADGHQKAVVYLTDGAPNSFVKEITKREWISTGWGSGYWTDREYTVYFEQPSGGRNNRNEWLDRNITDAEYGIEAARVTLGMLKASYPEAAVYTIGYGSYATGNNDWLKPLPTANDSEGMITSPNGSEGITRFFPAADYEQLMDVFETISDSTTTQIKVTNPVVTDQLSQNAVIYNGVTVPASDGSTVTGPRLRMDGQDLIASYSNGAIQYYADAAMSNPVAVFTPPEAGDQHNGTITWYVASELGNETRSLTFQVQAVGDHYTDAAQYPDIPNQNTGTHSSQNPSNGYYSNGTAELEYGPTDERETMDFPKPVIRPVQQYTSISLEKNVTGSNKPDSWSFTFQIGLDRELNTSTAGVETVENPNEIVEELKDFAYVYEVTLSNNSNEITIDGVPIGAAYRVVELAESTDTHKVVDTSYEIEDAKRTTIASGTGTAAPSGNHTIPADGLWITYTNEMGEYAVIEISKIVNDQNNLVADDTQFEFRVEYSQNNGANWETYSNYGQVLVRGGESVLVKIQPEDTGYLFRITETNTQNAVRTDYQIGNGQVTEGEYTANIGPLEEGEETEVTFTNHYYSHSIVLTKKVADQPTGESELIPDAEYTFTINFTVDGGHELLSQVNVSRNGGIAVAELVQNNSLTVKLKRDDILTISDLPEYVTGYTVTEDLGILNTEENTNGKFQVTLKGIEADSTGNTTPTIDQPNYSVKGTFTGTENQTDTITYTNEYSYLLEKLTITKTLVGSANDSSSVAADQNVTFTFEIVNLDTNESFTATITVEKGESSGNVVMQVPVSEDGYEIREVASTVRYEAVNQAVRAEYDDENGYSAEFQNYRTGDEYFTDVSTMVNEVDDSYKFTNGGATPVERIASSLDAVGAYLLPDQKKDGSGDDDMNQPT